MIAFTRRWRERVPARVAGLTAVGLDSSQSLDFRPELGTTVFKP